MNYILFTWRLVLKTSAAFHSSAKAKNLTGLTTHTLLFPQIWFFCCQFNSLEWHHQRFRQKEDCKRLEKCSNPNIMRNQSTEQRSRYIYLFHWKLLKRFFLFFFSSPDVHWRAKWTHHSFTKYDRLQRINNVVRQQSRPNHDTMSPPPRRRMAHVDTVEADGGRKKINQAADLAVHREPHGRERCETYDHKTHPSASFCHFLFTLNDVQRRQVSVLLARGDWHPVRRSEVCGVWTPPSFKAGCTTNTWVDRVLQHECKWILLYNIAALFICTVALKPHSSANEVIIIKGYKYLSRISGNSMYKSLLYNLCISHNANEKCWWGWAYLHLPKGTDPSHPGHILSTILRIN